MAATGKTPILLYGSTTPTNAPTAGNLTNSTDGCEIAINVADKNLFFKDSTNAVNTVPIRQSSASSNGWLSSTDWSTFNGKQSALVSGTNIKTVSGTTLLGSGDLGIIGTAYGGTGLTGFTSANNAIYSTSSSALTAGTLPIAAGGTAQTSFTSDRIHYGSFSTSANLTTDGTNLTLGTGNLVIGTSGKGIDFSATAGTGTSELLADYEEGTFTPVINQGFNAPITYTTQTGKYTKIGNTVYYSIYLYMAAGLTPNSDLMIIGGLPYTVGSATQAAGTLGYCSNVVAAGAPLPVTALQSTVIALYTTAGAAFAGTNLAGARPEISVFGFYQV